MQGTDLARKTQRQTTLFRRSANVEKKSVRSGKKLLDTDFVFPPSDKLQIHLFQHKIQHF
jgi:hypothetical protein